jgi:hypothetical protein
MEQSKELLLLSQRKFQLTPEELFSNHWSIVK